MTKPHQAITTHEIDVASGHSKSSFSTTMPGEKFIAAVNSLGSEKGERIVGLLPAQAADALNPSRET
jgi:hypothetical protein